MLKPEAVEKIPEETVRIAKAAFPKGSVIMKLRDEFGSLYKDEDFAELFSNTGQPALAAWRLALVTVFQYLENLTDRQAADAVRGRLDWKYALGLELADAGFDFSVLSEFRHRLVEGKREQLLLDAMLGHFTAKGLVKMGGKGRTDSSHVLAKVRILNRLELIGETLRATLNDLATVLPSWLQSIAEPEWYERYGTRVSDYRLPKSEEKRKAYALQVGADGYKLLDALAELPADIADRSAVQVLKAVWQQNFERQDEKLRWLRELQAAAPKGQRSPIASPYDPEAKRSVKRSTHWVGYKVHLSESCDDDMPHVITNVHLSAATEQDVSTTPQVHAQLKQKNLLPDTHLVDAG